MWSLLQQLRVANARRSHQKVVRNMSKLVQINFERQRNCARINSCPDLSIRLQNSLLFGIIYLLYLKGNIMFHWNLSRPCFKFPLSSPTPHNRFLNKPSYVQLFFLYCAIIKVELKTELNWTESNILIDRMPDCRFSTLPLSDVHVKYNGDSWFIRRICRTLLLSRKQNSSGSLEDLPAISKTDLANK